MPLLDELPGLVHGGLSRMTQTHRADVDSIHLAFSGRLKVSLLPGAGLALAAGGVPLRVTARKP